ncbi:MAG: GNAT family N-acetyltransferase [Methanosphaera stadtmanae]|nr:GNAT family N-acetyltransferase [Methanosphaera stadtmanae]
MFIKIIIIYKIIGENDKYLNIITKVMTFIKKYNYQKFSIGDVQLNNFQKNKFDVILNQEGYIKFFSDNTLNYFILYHNKLVGFFTLKIKKNLIELSCLYIFEECRNKYVATYVLNDIIFTVRHNLLYNVEYIVANSFVESSMFFLKNGFDFCKLNKKLDYKKKNIILLYKRIC